jgi:hypothetical protein
MPVKTNVEIWFIALVMISWNVNAQQLQIDKTSISGDKIVVYYSLVDTIPGKYYTVRLYGSHDNFMHPLEKISGDAGIDLRPGGQKKIMWDPKELGETFEGKIALEIKARTYIPFVQFDGFEEYKLIKRLKPYTIIWRGGTPQNILNFDLYKEDERIMTYPNIANVGHHTLLLPRSVKPGTYKLKISDTKNKDDVVFTEEFRVKRKTPLVLKALPLLALGAVISILLNAEEPQAFRIPDPISPQ